MSDIDQRPTEPSEGLTHIAGTARYDALLNELRSLLNMAPEPDEHIFPAPQRRVAAHG